MDTRFSNETLLLVLAALVAAVVVFASGYWAGMATASSESAVASTAPTFPDWFLPIWDAYDRNPAVTPTFDFASLFSGDPDGTPSGVR